MGMWVAIGTAIGIGVGAAMDNISMGAAMGVAMGAALGAVLSGTKRDRDDDRKPRFNLRARPRRYSVLCGSPGQGTGSARGCGSQGIGERTKVSARSC